MIRSNNPGVYQIIIGFDTCVWEQGISLLNSSRSLFQAFLHDMWENNSTWK